MKDVSNFLSLAALVILFGYITFNETRPQRSTRNAEGFSDDGVIAPAYEGGMPPLAAVSFDIPKDLTFAGEKVPIELPDVEERLDKEIQINTYLHSNTIFLIKRANRWLPPIRKILEENDIPADFQYLPLIESNLLNVISPKDAVGYWQILKTSGKEYGLEISNEVDERYDPLKATRAACKYLRKAYEKFGDWTLVAASYNRGIAGMSRALEDQQVESYYDLYLNDETSRYVFRLLAIKEIVNNPAKYGFRIDARHLYPEERLRYVDVKESISSLVSFAHKQGTNYKLLKRHNPWLRDDKLTVKKGKTYRLAIPES